MKHHLISMRTTFHYLAALVFIAIYGVQVCPYIENLTAVQLAIPLIAVMVVQYILRLAVVPGLIASSNYAGQVSRTFILEWSLFVFSGLLFTLSNSMNYGFPISSGIKMTLGFATLGFFTAMDLALEREYRLARMFQRDNIIFSPASRYFPLVKKFSLFATFSIVFLLGVLFLVLNKDLDWLLDASLKTSRIEAQRSVLVEFAFVGIILAVYTLNVIFSYMRNMNYFFTNENRVLAEATSGKLDSTVAVSTNDEFGVMAYHTNIMIKTLLERTQALQQTQDAIIFGLASLAETRDNETGAHILRTQRYVRALARALRSHPRFEKILNEETINFIFKSAPLHDIGKVGIPDRILLKPGSLSDEEFRIMKTHTVLGDEALKVAERGLGGTSFLSYAREIALTHHEKWDGSGYPKGLKGEDIPISGRLMAAADVYDALISKRVYKPGYSHDKAIKIILEGKGTHFDPDVVDALLTIEDEFKSIAAKYTDKAYEVETKIG